MKVTCEDRERILLDGTAEEWLALEQHGAHCDDCGDELRAWKQLSVAAAELREYRDDPALWSRIEGSLARDGRKACRKPGWWESILGPVAEDLAVGAGGSDGAGVGACGWISDCGPAQHPRDEQDRLVERRDTSPRSSGLSRNI